MKLVHVNVERHIDFSICPAYIFVIENAKEYYKLTSELYRQYSGEDGNFALSENGIISIEKNVLFIYDFFQIALDTKKIENIINAMVMAEFKKGDYIKLLNEINEKIINLNEKVLQNIDLNLTYEDVFDSEKFVKLSHYKVKEESTLIEKIIAYIDMYVKIKGIRVVTFVNAFSFFNKEEICQILKQLNYMQLYCIFFEPCKSYDIENTKTIIIDNDLCVI